MKVKNVMMPLRSYDNCDVNIMVITNSGLYVRCGNRFSVALLMGGR